MFKLLLLTRFPAYPLTARRHPHCPHPHWAQLMQPEERTTGPAQSGQTRIRCETFSGPSVRPSACPPLLGWYVVGLT